MPQTLTRPPRSLRASPILEVRVRADGPAGAVLSLDGECDITSACILAAAIHEQLRTGRRFVRLDLSALRFIDAGGLGAIVSARGQLLAHHGGLVIEGVGPRTRRVLELCRLDTLLGPAPSPRP